MGLDELNQQLNELWEQVQVYFGQLNDYEKYAWGAEALGLILVVTGVVLFF